MYKFLLKPGWMTLHIIALFLAILFSNFGLWQLRRLEQRRSSNALIESRMTLEPEPLATLLATNELANLEHRPATTAGVYDTSFEVLQRVAVNYNGQPGYYLLTPLVLDDDTAVLVRRGWVPFELNTPPVAEAKPPTVQVAITGRLNPSFARPSGFLASLAARDPPGDLDITAYVDLERLESQMPYSLVPVFIDLTEQVPASGHFPLPLPEPELTEGSHLGYALQWFAFVVIGVVGYSIILWQTAQSQGSALTSKKQVVTEQNNPERSSPVPDSQS